MTDDGRGKWEEGGGKEQNPIQLEVNQLSHSLFLIQYFAVFQPMTNYPVTDDQ